MKKENLKYLLKIPPSSKGEANTILVILLVIASFLIGSLWTRVQFMEKGNITTGEKVAGTETGNNPSPQTPPPTQAVGKVPEITEKDHIRGDKNANLALIEYSDLECPFCKTFHPTMQKVVDEYKGKIMWVYRHFPLSFHANAQKEAEAAECAAEQGGNDAFWKYIDTIFERTTSNGTGFALDKLVPLAKEIGLDEAKFKECLDGSTQAKTVQDDLSGGSAAGVSGTPGTIVLNRKTKATQMIPGALPYEEVKKVVDQMLP